jgi:hypothetical protein
MAAEYMSLDSIDRKLQRIQNNPQKWRTHVLWHEILLTYFPSVENWEVISHKDTLKRKAHHTLSRVSEGNSTKTAILMLEAFGAVAGDIPTHDQVAYEQWAEDIFEANHGATRLYAAVCLGLEVKFYWYDRNGPNPHPSGGVGDISPLSITNRRGQIVSGVISIRDTPEDIEDVLLYIKAKTIR